MNAPRGITTGIVTACLTLSASGMAGAAEPPGGATPEELYGRFRQAVEAEDLVELSRCLSSADAAEIVMGSYVAASMGVAFKSPDDKAAAEAGEARLDGILRQHGVELGPDDLPTALQGGPMPANVMALADPGALVADLTAFATELGLEPHTTGPMPAFGDLADLEIEGDMAQATTNEGPIRFVRRDGRWFLGEGALKETGSSGAEE